MPTVKCTMFMQLATNLSLPAEAQRRIGGWSETVYRTGGDVAGAIRALNGEERFAGPDLCATRAQLLPTGAAIVGQRFQVIDPVGLAQSTSATFPGSSGLAADIPQMCLYCKVPAVGTPNIRKLFLRGIPDARVIEGEFQPLAGWRGIVQRYFTSLSGFAFRARDLTAPAARIISITPEGLVTTEDPHPFAINNMLRILRSLAADGNFGGGRFQVQNLGSSNVTFQLRGWDGGATVGGTARLDRIIYPAFDGNSATIGRIIVKKVGRPFGGYRGRVSNKR